MNIIKLNGFALFCALIRSESLVPVETMDLSVVSSVFYYSSFIKFIPILFQGHLIIESENVGGNVEGVHVPPVENIQSLPLIAEASDSAQSKSFYRLSCPATSECLPVSECSRGLVDVIRKCYAGDKSMFCGLNNDYDPYICCPRRDSYNTDDICGRSLVTGQSYYGLGAFPFVARIGFKSEYIYLFTALKLNVSKYSYCSMYIILLFF